MSLRTSSKARPVLLALFASSNSTYLPSRHHKLLLTYFEKMKNAIFTALAICAATTNSQVLGLDLLDISELLGIGPAPMSDPRFNDYRPPGDGDVRSPCPGLNTLANHGFLNRNGKDITIPQLIAGGAQGLHVGPDFMTLIGTIGLLTGGKPLSGKFDLSDLDQHNAFNEHDGSLSRLDAYFGSDSEFNQDIFDSFFAPFHGMNKTTTPVASKARIARVEDSSKRNPTFVYGPQQFILSGGETGLYVQCFSSPSENSARTDFVRYFFENERLPVELGWTVSPEEINLVSLGEYILEQEAANPDVVGEGLAIVAGTYGMTLFDIAGGANVLSNLTDGIFEQLDLPFLS